MSLSILHFSTQVVAATALGFEACDYRCRQAVASSLRVFVDIEVETASKRLEDLSKLSHKLRQVDCYADSKSFVNSAKQPDLTHASSAALSLLHDPTNRGALVGMASPKSVPNSHGRPNLPYAERVPQPVESTVKIAAAETESEEEEVVFETTDRTQEDMEVIVTALFKSMPKKETPPSVPEDQGSASNDNPLHPLQFNPTESTSSQPLLSGNQKRRFAKLLESRRGQEALVKQLNQQRSKRTEIEDGFEELASAVGFVLDKCRENHDVHNAKMAMMLSQVSTLNSQLSVIYLTFLFCSDILSRDCGCWRQCCRQCWEEQRRA